MINFILSSTHKKWYNFNMKKIKNQQNIFPKLSFFILFSIVLSSCATGNDYQDPWDNSRTPPYGRPGYENDRYGYGNDRYGRDPYYNREYWKNKNKDRYEDRRPHHSYDAPPKHYDTVPPRAEVRPEAAIRPNCPPDTTFDGRHCIVPENRRRSGGKGTVNACPKGMWLSGDHCVKD